MTTEQLVRVLARSRVPALDRITHVNEHQTGIQLSYEITPLLNGGALLLYDWKGASAAFVPSLSYSASTDIVVTLAGQVFVGRDGGDTEYGDAPGLLILSLEAYF